MQRGFTLLELIVVLVIVAVMVSVAIPALSNRSGTELRAAARTIAAKLRQTRHTAITSRQSAALAIDVEERTIQLKEAIKTFPESLSLRVFTARSETTGPGEGSIRFFPDGSSTGGEIAVSLADRGYAIQVDWFSGKVKTFAYEGELPERSEGNLYGRFKAGNEVL